MAGVRLYVVSSAVLAVGDYYRVLRFGSFRFRSGDSKDAVRVQVVHRLDGILRVLTRPAVDLFVAVAAAEAKVADVDAVHSIPRVDLETTE